MALLNSQLTSWKPLQGSQPHIFHIKTSIDLQGSVEPVQFPLAGVEMEIDRSGMFLDLRERMSPDRSPSPNLGPLESLESSQAAPESSGVR
mmetsp:Transcript_72677/g.160476  ORF Transcript_72677/g.160476 Transcript_72677/m.160476 type:complete len:91 (-) Transcript_72677:909-1181(-)